MPGVLQSRTDDSPNRHALYAGQHSLSTFAGGDDVQVRVIRGREHARNKRPRIDRIEGGTDDVQQVAAVTRLVPATQKTGVQ